MNNINDLYIDPSHDILSLDGNPLDSIFSPKSVAVIGATDKMGSVGRTILWNLISSPFGGTVYPVNPKRDSVLGVKAYPSITAITDKIDLAVIIIPGPYVPAVIQECADKGIKGAIIISAGFKEIGPEGVELEEKIMAIAKKSNMRIIGPNCLGVMNTHIGMNATFGADIAKKGNIGFLSQSGALCTSVLDWSLRENVGFSHFVSVGSMLDVDWGDLIYYLGNDPNTHSIVMYMESIGNAQSFLSAAREVALTKPIIVIKPGRTEAAAEAAASHTGSLAGSDDVLEAAFRRCGVLRVKRIEELFSLSDFLAKQPRPKGNRLTIVSNAGGPGVLATDELVASGGELTVISPEVIEELNKHMPPAWSHGNPIDVLGDAPPERYAKALELAVEDENSDGTLVILTPQDMTDSTATAKLLAQYAHKYDKPILASWMGGDDVREGQDILNNAGIPTFDYPDDAVKAFASLAKYNKNLDALYETPHAIQNIEKNENINLDINAIRESGRDLLTEWESKKLLEKYNIPTIKTEIAVTEEDAVNAANSMGYPVVLKIHSETITHKTDVGGVILNLKDAEAVSKAYNQIKNSVTEKVGAEHFDGVSVQQMADLSDCYELIVGSSLDPQFGPVMLFGTGGQLVEVFKDSSLALPPLTTTLARRMVERTKIYEALKGVRGRDSIDFSKLENLLVKFGELIVENPIIKEIDINPLLVSDKQIIALDARVILHEKEIPNNELPKPAIAPYPSQYISELRTKDSQVMTVRPIKPEDEAKMEKFMSSISDESIYLRFLKQMPLAERVTHDRLSRICFNDYNREIALVAVSSNDEIAGVCRLSRRPNKDNEATIRVLVTDSYHGKGIASQLILKIIEVAKQENITSLYAQLMQDNEELLHLTKKHGFAVHSVEDEKTQMVLSI